MASIPVGSAVINNDIRSTAIPAGMIERLKTQCGYAITSAIPADRLNSSVKINTHSPHQKNKEITFRDLTTIINARMLDIVDLVNSEIRASGYHNHLPSGIILTGGGSRLMGVDVLFKEHTGYDVRLGAAEDNLSAESMDGTSAPELATAIGLLAMGIAESDIAPSDYTRQRKVAQTTEEVTTVVTPTPPTKEKEPQKPNDKPKDGKKPEGVKKSEGGKPGFFGKMAKWLDEAVFGNGVVDDDMQ